MAEIESKPWVVNFNALLTPVSEENPAGEYLRYSGLYDEISEARRADEVLSQGDWQTDLKVADYRKVIEVASAAIEKDTKDLQVAAWLSEALIRVHGLVGLRDALRLLTRLQDTFWDTLHPVVDEGDMEGRANALAWMEEQAAFAIKQAKITGNIGYSLIDFEDSKKFDVPENIESLETAEQERLIELREQAERENRVTANKWRAEMSETRRAFCEETNFLIEECWTAYNGLNKTIEEKFDLNQAPSLNNLRKSLDEVQSLVKKILDEKRLEEPDAADELGESEADGESGTIQVAGVAVATGAIKSRQDALKRLNDVADWFRKNEPHSPISYIVGRAVKWGNMPFEAWLQDVIKDETVIYSLRQTLGLNTGVPDSTEQ
jgi:type VI secretion system protein ImpA